MSLYDMNPLDDEEERKRREAIAARMDEEASANPVGPVNPSFMDRLGQGISNRFTNRLDQVGNTLMNPAQAIEQRTMNELGQQQQEEAANTEVKTQTTKTYGDGSQEHTVKTQIPAEQAQAQQKQAPMNAMMGPVAPNSPEAQQQAQQFAQAMAQAQQKPSTLTTPIPGMPQNLPAQGAIPPQAAQQAPVMAKLPQPGPAVQVAGATQMPTQAAAPGASLAQAGAQAQARPTQAIPATPFTPTAEREVAQPKPWVQAANDAGTDLRKLFDVAANHPESRDMIQAKMEQALKNKTKEDEAMAIMTAAQNGDLKAMNKIQQSIKPETGKPKEEVTVNDYLKAVLYKRLGLDALAADVQAKIIGKETKFGQATIAGTNWETETDSSGRIIRAKDDEGNIATESTLNKLRANSTKAGTHAFGFTGEAATIPVGQADAGQEYRQRTNAISGAIENVITTGPNAGRIYSGPPGSAKSVGTSYSKALNDAYIKFQTAPTTEMAKSMMEIAGQVDSGDGKTIAMVNERIRQMSPGIFNQITSGQAGTPPAPTGVAGTPTADEVARAQRNIDSLQREMKQKPAGFSQKTESDRQAILQKELADNQAIVARAGGVTSTGAGAGTSLAAMKANVGTQAALAEAEGKPPAEARGKGKAQDINNQRTADENYSMIQPIADLIKKSTGSGIGSRVDSLAGLFGVGTAGSQAIAQLNVLSYPFQYNIPRFEGPQSDRDTAVYQKAAGDFANDKEPVSKRLAALQGMITLMKKYDKEGKNDWSYGGINPTEQGKAQPGVTSSGNKYKKVQ